MTSYHAPTPYVGSKGHDADHRKKFEFWKLKEKSSADTVSPSSQGSSLPSTPIPTKPINIPIATPSSSSSQEVNPINAQPRTNVNTNTPSTLNASPSNSHINNFNFTSLPRGRTNSEAIPPSPSIINLQNRMRTSHDGDFSSSSVQPNASLPNGIDSHNRKVNTSAGSSNTTTSTQSKPSLSSSGSHNVHNLPSTSSTTSNQSNTSKSSPSTAIRSTSLHSVKESSANESALRRRSLNEKFMSELTLQERPNKIIKSDDEIKLLLQKIENSEHLLNSLEAQLKKETLKRIDNKYRRELEATLNTGGTKTGGGAEQQILQELENYKKLEATYREVLDEVTASKDKLAKLNEQLSIGALDALETGSKRRLSVRNASNPSIVPESDIPKRKTSSFNEAISSLKRDISRTSIKLLRPLAPIKRQSSKSNNLKPEPPEPAPTVAETGTESDGEVETRTVHAELFKQLIQQKYACAENVRSPFIKNLRAKWRQRVSKSDSWMSRLQNGELVHQWEGEEPEEMELDEEELLEDSGVMPHVRKHGSKSQGYIAPPEDMANRFSRKDGEIMLPNKFNYGYKGTYSDSATSSYIADDISDDDGSAISEGRKRMKKSGKLKSMFAKEKPAHLDQTDVGRLAETLKRRPTHQQLVSKRILRGDAVFGVSLENLIDIPEGIRMMADFLADSGNMDLLDVPGNDRDVINLQNSIDTGNHSLDMMQLLPYATGTLFMRFFQQLPEKLLSQQLSPKFLWVQETELPTLRYAMFRSLIFLLIVPHRNMLAFLFKWLRKMSEDPRKSMYYTPAYLGNLFGNLIVHGVDMGKAANTTQRLIEDYKRVFLDAEPDIRHFMKEGRQLVKWATVDRLIEKVIDPNCYDEQLPPMFFFCHIYIIGAKDLLDKFIGIYLKLKIGPPATWKSETCRRIITLLKLWIDNHGLALSSNEPFVAVLADFMKSRRDSADPDATEKELDRTLFTYRTQQNFMSTLPSISGIPRPISTQIGGALSASGSGGRAKQLRIPATIMEQAPREPDALALMTSMSAPSSPRDSADDVTPARTLTQAVSVAHLSRTPPKPLSIAYLNNEASSKLGKSPPRNSKVPTTPLPSSSQPTAVPLLRNNRLTRGPIPPFPSGSSPPLRAGSPIRPRAISNASALHNSSPSSSPPTVVPSSSPFNSSSPPPPTKYYAAPTLSPSTSSRGRSFSKATNLEVIIPDDSSKTKNIPQQNDERKTFRYTTTYKGSIPRNTNYPNDVPFSPTYASLPVPPSFSSTTSPSSIQSSHSGTLSPPTSPNLMFPISPTSPTSPSSPSLPSSSLAMSYSVNTVTFAADVNFDNSSNSTGFQIPKSTSVDSHLANADGQVKRNRAYSVAHGRSASAQLPLPGPTASTDLLEIDPKLIAEHMTIVDHELLKAIPMSELLHKNYMDCKASPNFANMAMKLNEWGSWTLKEILRQTDLYTRANVLSLFIEISKENLSYNNFNSCCAILGALNNPAIQRLKNTWEKVNKKTMSKFRKMMELFDFTYNSKNYREALKITKPPAVPYLENGMCNIDKMRTLYKILCEVQLFQKKEYTFKVFPEFMRRLRTLKDLYTDEEAYQQSLKIEPREIMTV